MPWISKSEWLTMTRDEQKAASLKALGCLHGLPSWERDNSECLHIDCRIARGEAPPIVMANSILLGEMKAGWLRSLRDGDAECRAELAKIVWELRRRCRAEGQYDPWRVHGGWELIVSGIFGGA